MRVVLVAAALAVSACSILEPRPDYSKFFVLSAVSQGEVEEPVKNVVIGLGPIKFPDYLDRSQRVVRVGPNQLRFSDTERWAEPLERNFSRVLSQNLSAELRTQDIYTFPWFTSVPISHTVAVDVLQFDTDTEGDARLRVRWALKESSSDRVVASRESTFEEKPDGEGGEAAIAALSEVVGRLSEEIAAAIREAR